MAGLRVLHLGGGEWPGRLLLAPGASMSVEVEHNIDMDPHVEGAIGHNLDIVPWPVQSNFYDEVHAYEVLEHLGQQGDSAAFFETFREIWRVLKMGGTVAASTPGWQDIWAFGDPDHKRVINHATITFLLKQSYVDGLRRVYMPMVEPYWWALRHSNYSDGRYWFVLEKIDGR